MNRRSRHIILALVAVVALGAGGGAYATAKKQSRSTKQEQRSSKQRRSFQQQGTNRPQQFDRGDCPGGPGGPGFFSEATKNLNADVQAGRLSESEKNQILDHIRSNLNDLVNGQGPRFEGRPGFGPGDGQFGPPDGQFDGQFGPPGGSGSNAPSGSQGAGYFT